MEVSWQKETVSNMTLGGCKLFLLSQLTQYESILWPQTLRDVKQHGAMHTPKKTFLKHFYLQSGWSLHLGLTDPRVSAPVNAAG